MPEQLGFNLFAEPAKPIVPKAKIKQMNCQLIVGAYEYYQVNKPSVTDMEYDGLYETYKEALSTTNYRPFHDMSQKVGTPSRYTYHAALLGIRR